MLVVRLTDDVDNVWSNLKQRIARLLVKPNIGEILLEKGGFDSSILGPLRAAAQKDGGQSAIDLVSDEMVDSFYVVGGASNVKSVSPNIVRPEWTCPCCFRGSRTSAKWLNRSSARPVPSIVSPVPFIVSSVPPIVSIEGIRESVQTFDTQIGSRDILFSSDQHLGHSL